MTKRIGGRQTSGSGNQTMKGDVRIPGKERIECKSTIHGSFGLTREMIHKIESAAASTGETWAIQIDYLRPDGKVERSVIVRPFNE